MSLNLSIPRTEFEPGGTFATQVARRLSKRLSQSSGSRESARIAAAIYQGEESAVQNMTEETFPPHFTLYESNNDIRKGPITHRSGHSATRSGNANAGVATAIGSGADLAGASNSNSMGQSQDAAGQRNTGQARLLGEGSSSQGGLTQPVSGEQSNSNSDKGTGNNASTDDSIAEGTATAVGIVGGASLVARSSSAKSTEDSLEQELREQSHIDSDVFTSGRSNRAAARGLSGNKDTTEATHAPKDTFAKSQSKKKTSRKEQGTTSQSSKSIFSAAGLGLTATGAGVVGVGTLGTTGGLKQDANKGVLRQGEPSRDIFTTHPMSNLQGTRAVQNFGGSGYKMTVLQERIPAVGQKCKTQLGLSASEISKRIPTVDAFFDAVAAQRLRWMPRDGSRLDCSLRWASRLAYAVDALRKSVGKFAPGANEASKLIWGLEVLLLEVSLPPNTPLWKLLLILLNSLMLTTRIFLKAFLADMVALPLVSFCFYSMRVLTRATLSFSRKLSLSMPTCLRWFAALQRAASKASKARSQNKAQTIMSMQPL